MPKNVTPIEPVLIATTSVLLLGTSGLRLKFVLKIKKREQMTRKKPNPFEIGDRVAERPKATAIPNLSPAAVAIAAANRTQRYGVVTGLKVKVNRQGAKTNYVEVLWDHLTTPSIHAQCRLCHIKDHKRIVEDYCFSLG
jgi:hypothetical protein